MAAIEAEYQGKVAEHIGTLEGKLEIATEVATAAAEFIQAESSGATIDRRLDSYVELRSSVHRWLEGGSR